ncbi:MAG: TIGR01212 family radical SAM protein [Ruminococcus sp.]|nr:TIGR01212 family radical SAM protein [Ruminococcus sp.]
MKHFYSLSDYCKEKFGWKVYKLSLSSGCSCPNRDGKLGTKGCIFCSNGGSGEFAESAYLSVTEQLRAAKTRVEEKYKGASYIAYFQPFSNTYGDPAYLRALYYEAIAPHCVVGLSVATRPDCLEDEIIDLLSQINRVKPVTVELGLQTIHESTARYIRRGYSLSVYDDAVERLHKEGIEVVTHLILGLPGETPQMMLDSVKYVGQRTDGIKLQLLHVIEGTDLAEEYRKGRFQTLTLEEYTDILCRAIELLPEKVVIHRITGDGDKRSLIAPLWSADKKRVLNYINSEMDRRDLKQGSKL